MNRKLKCVLALLVVLMTFTTKAKGNFYFNVESETNLTGERLTNIIKFIRRVEEAGGEELSQPVIIVYTNCPVTVVTNNCDWTGKDYWEAFEKGALWAHSNGYDQCSHTTNWAFTNSPCVIITNQSYKFE